MKLFQLEEPEQGSTDPSLPGAAIGIDASGAIAEAAFAVGGNAQVLSDPAEFARALPVPSAAATAAEWEALFEAVRLRAERLLARRVTHAVVVLAAPLAGAAMLLDAAAQRVGIGILGLPSASQISGEDGPLLAAARLAEDLQPRSGTKTPPEADFI